MKSLSWVMYDIEPYPRPTHTPLVANIVCWWFTAESHTRNFPLKRNSLTQAQGWSLSDAWCHRAAVLPWFTPGLKENVSSRDSPWIHWRGFCCNFIADELLPLRILLPLLSHRCYCKQTLLQILLETCACEISFQCLFPLDPNLRQSI